MSEPKKKTTPADMGLQLFEVVDRCKQRDGQMCDAFVKISADDAQRLETTANFLMLIDGHQEAIRSLVAGSRRRNAA